MATLYLSLGTNLGDRQLNLETALTLIGQKIGTIQAMSGVLETVSWGYDSPNRFLNLAVKVKTGLTPQETLKASKGIEKEMGRTTKTDTNGYQDRIIDIDILMYNDMVMETPELTLPHKLMHKRRFVLEPLAEIAPELVHPVMQKTIRELLHDTE